MRHSFTFIKAGEFKCDKCGFVTHNRDGDFDLVCKNEYCTRVLQQELKELSRRLLELTNYRCLVVIAVDKDLHGTFASSAVLNDDIENPVQRISDFTDKIKSFIHENELKI